MDRSDDVSVRSIQIDGRWELEDLAAFSSDFNQIYAFFYTIDPEAPGSRANRQQPLHKYPFAGGYSYLNFFRLNQASVPPRFRARIASLRYSSPGEIDLAMLINAGTAVLTLLAAIGANWQHLANLYARIQEFMRHNKLAKLPEQDSKKIPEETQEQLREKMYQLATKMGLEQNQVNQILKMTGSVLTTTKILLALYRRGERLAQLHIDKKIRGWD